MNTVIKERVLAATRLLLVILSFVNTILVAQGLSPIPVNDDAVLTWVTYGVDGALLLYFGWWKNNNVTKKAIARQKSY